MNKSKEEKEILLLSLCFHQGRVGPLYVSPAACVLQFTPSTNTFLPFL